MNLKIIRPPEEQAIIDALLPKEPLTVKLMDTLMKVCRKPLLEALKAEIEIYKAYPKKGQMDIKTFDTRNHKKCFMGQGFRVSNSEWGDSDLAEYRAAVGTIHHGTWGNCTLLEAWGGDHYAQYPQMVKGVFSYARGTRDTLPTLKFHIFPLFRNSKSGTWNFDDDDKDKYEHKWLMEINGFLQTQAGEMGLKKKPQIYTSESFKKDESLKKDFERDWERHKRGF